MKTLFLPAALALALCPAACLLACGPRPAEGPSLLEGHLSSSVTVAARGEFGSGVIFKNGGHSFVWTAGHVVSECQRVEAVLSPGAGPSLVIRYSDVAVSQPVFRGGRKVGEDARYARVVRYSAHEHGGDDLALLEVRDPDFGGPGVTFLAEKSFPRPGEALWHVGSMLGPRGTRSVCDGVFSTAGRLRTAGSLTDEVTRPAVFDQVTVPTLKGCSGGGFWRKSTGECVGLLSGGLDETTEAGSLIAPARNVWSLARRTKCVWAVTRDEPVPDEVGVVTDRPVPAARK